MIKFGVIGAVNFLKMYWIKVSIDFAHFEAAFSRLALPLRGNASLGNAASKCAKSIDKLFYPVNFFLN